MSANFIVDKTNETFNYISKFKNHENRFTFFFLGQSISLYLIKGYKAGFYRSTILKLHPPICRIIPHNNARLTFHNFSSNTKWEFYSCYFDLHSDKNNILIKSFLRIFLYYYIRLECWMLFVVCKCEMWAYLLVRLMQ